MGWKNNCVPSGGTFFSPIRELQIKSLSDLGETRGARDGGGKVRERETFVLRQLL